MLKTLRITSRVVVALAVCGVIFMFFLGLRGDSEIMEYLQDPGIIQQFEDEESERVKKDIESPLVVQANEFALRIDPPPPPAPPKPIEQPKTDRDVVRGEPQEPPRPKGPVSAKFELLATVQCETDPTRSMVLLKQATGKEEWFWLGEKAFGLKIDEVRNGSAIFSQDGRNPQELFVPAKPQAPSLLKGEAITSAFSPARPGRIDIQVDTDLPSSASDLPSPSEIDQPVPTTPAGALSRVRRLRTGNVTALPPVQREPVRAEPDEPTPEEQKAALEESISGIQELMSRQDSGLDEQERQEENKVWMELLKTLQTEKENLESAVKPEETGAEQPQPDEEEPKSRISENDPNQEE